MAYRVDTTQTGYLLGHAQHLSDQATPERDLPPVACTIIRLILHATLVWSSVCVKVKTSILIPIASYLHNYNYVFMHISYIRRVRK